MPSTATSILDGLSTSTAVKAPVAAVTNVNITLAGLQGHDEDDRILVWQQSTESENGIYAASSGSWTRTKDFDGNRDVRRGTLIPVEGSAILYRVTTSNPIVIGTSSISFEALGPTQTQGDIGLLLYPRTAAEIAADVTPVNYFKAPGDALRYGTNTTPGTTDMSSAIQAALNSNLEVWLDGTFKASGLTMSTDGQRLYATSRGSGIVAANTTQPAVTLSGNRQIVSGVYFDSGLTTADSTPDFCAVKITGTRCLVDGVATAGVWCRGVRFVGALYSRLTNSNIDGWRKRAVSIESGGTFNRIDHNMLFEGSLTAPAEAIVYLDSSPSTWIQNNHITRGTGKGIYCTGTSPLQQLVTIENNDIDYLENWAIDIDGNWNVRIVKNWCAGGQNATGTPTGQIRIQNADRIVINNNDMDGALQVGCRSIYMNLCNYGEISGNTCQYTSEGIVVEASNYIEVHDNIVGQLTGLPPTGVPMTYCYVGVSLTLSNHVHWHDNIGYNPTTAIYQDIPATTIQDYQLFSCASLLDGLSPTTDNSTRLGNSNLRWASVNANAYYVGAGAAGVFWSAGTGSPEGVVTAPISSLYSRTDGGAGTSLYIKQSGTGNTGWAAVTP